MILFPPYYAGWGDKSDHHAGDADFDTILDASANNMTGEIYTLNQNYIHNPGDSASQLTTTSGNMQFYFQSPYTGSLKIVATLECRDSYYNGSVVDESGWSDNSISQVSQLSMWIDGENSAIRTLVNYGWGAGASGQWGPQRIGQPGEVRRFEYLPNVPRTAGDWVVMQLAILDQQLVWVNDMRFSGNITNYWIIRSLDVTGP